MSGLGIIAMVLVRGTKQTGCWFGRWISANDLEGSQRAGGVVLRIFGCVALVWFVGGFLWAMGWLQYVLPMVWVVFAAINGGDADEETATAVEADDRPEHDDVARALHDLIGYRNGVHLASVAVRLGVEQPVVRELLDEMEVRHKTVKIKKCECGCKGVAVGVHRDHLPPLPSPLAESESVQVAGSAAGQSATATLPPS
jgi:hypothetical protein